MVLSNEIEYEIKAHLMGNYLNIEGYPVILAIVGPPGMGKSYQTKEILDKLKVKRFYISAADFENQWAGLPAQMFRERYIEASRYIDKNKPSVLVIDDIDTTLGEWKDSFSTVNHQALIAFIMHIADNPTRIEYTDGVTIKELDVNRVPIIVTGNYVEKMYEPLVRAGRTSIFRWNPSLEQKKEIVKGIFPSSADALIEEIIDKYPEKSIADFSQIYFSANKKFLVENAKQFSMTRVLFDKKQKETKREYFYKNLRELDWVSFFNENKEAIWEDKNDGTVSG